MRTRVTAPSVRQFWETKADIEVLRIHYCYQVGSALAVMALMEDAVISAMRMCSKIKLANKLGQDASEWERFLAKDGQLRDSTFGSLISILAKHDVAAEDIAYLRWVKGKRDFLVHRFFHQGQWPGDLHYAEDIDAMCRRLLYLELIFHRAGNRIWKIFDKADLLEYNELGDGSVLIVNNFGPTETFSGPPSED